MKQTLSLLTALLLAPLAALSQSPATPSPGAEIVSIMSTDFSRAHDADDWFDVVMFCTDPALWPVGVVNDWHFSTGKWEDQEESLRPLLASIGAEKMPTPRGVRGKLKRAPDGTISAPTDRDYDGAKFILDTMRGAKGKVRLINVGSLRNEALAYSMEPELFKAKLDRLYILGGKLDGGGECNLNAPASRLKKSCRGLKSNFLSFFAPFPLLNRAVSSRGALNDLAHLHDG